LFGRTRRWEREAAQNVLRGRAILKAKSFTRPVAILVFGPFAGGRAQTVGKFPDFRLLLSPTVWLRAAGLWSPRTPRRVCGQDEFNQYVQVQ
jgi:hypothetical protein